MRIFTSLYYIAWILYNMNILTFAKYVLGWLETTSAKASLNPMKDRVEALPLGELALVKVAALKTAANVLKSLYVFSILYHYYRRYTWNNNNNIISTDQMRIDSLIFFMLHNRFNTA